MSSRPAAGLFTGEALLLFGIAVVALVAWFWLAFGHARFWVLERAAVPPAPAAWPEVVAVVPARDEAEHIAGALASLWAQAARGRRQESAASRREQASVRPLAATRMGRWEGRALA